MKALDVLRDLGPGPEPPVEVKDRVERGLMQSLHPALVSQVGGDGAPGASGAVASAPSVGLGSGVWPLITAALISGGLVGAAGYAVLGPERVRVVYVDRPVLVTAPAASAALASAGAASTSASPVLPADLPLQASARVTVPVRASASADAESLLAKERTLLDRARRHMAAGEPAVTLEVTQRHEREFPGGLLVEEREAMAIRALLALGNTEAARARGERFVARFPGSLLAPALAPALAP